MENSRMGRRTSPDDPLNRSLPPGQDPVAHNPYGLSRQVADAQASLSEQLQALEGEKISLMKRLNMVLAELEKATHEKSDVALKLREQERHADELRAKLQEVSSLKTVVNKNLQNDLNFEQDLNSQLRGELGRLETEKDTLLVKLKEEEELGAEIAHETHSVSTSLHRKVDDLKRLEMEHDANSRRLRELNDQLEVLRSQEINTRQQSVHLEEQLADLSAQRNDLTRRISDLTQKYDGYVHHMSGERADLSRANKSTVRMLVAKLLVQIMDENIRLKRKNAFQRIFETSKMVWKARNGQIKLVKAFAHYYEDRRRQALRHWYRNAFNCVYESRKRTHLIDTNVAEGRRRKFFYQWREAYLSRKNSFGGKLEAAKIIQRLKIRLEERRVREYVCRWRDAVQLRHAQSAFLNMTSNRTQKNRIQRAFVMWLGFTRREALLDRYEGLSDVVTQTWFKQRVFLALKHACSVQRTETSMMKFTAWKNWCETAREKKYFAKKRILVERQNGLRTGRLLKQVWDAIRYYNVQTKHEDTREVLAKKIPEKEALEYRRECLINNAAARTKIHAVRQFYLKHCDVQYRALMIWKEACIHHRHTMNRFKMQVTHWNKRGLARGFMKWKEHRDKEVHQELQFITKEHLNENQNLTNEVTKKRKTKQAQLDRSGRHQMNKLDHIINMLNRHSMKKCYYHWVEGACKINNIDTGLTKLQKIITKGRLRAGFVKYRLCSKEHKRSEFVMKRQDWMIMMRGNASLKDCWKGWMHYIKTIQLARRFMNRAQNGMERNQRSEAFYKWKTVMANEIHQNFEMNIQELNTRQQEQSMSIARTKQDIQEDRNSKQHLKYQMKSLSNKVMANFVERAMNMNIARGFYTWRDSVKDHNTKSRTVRKAILYMSRRNLSSAFRSWCVNSQQMAENQLQSALADQEDLRKKTVQQGKMSMAAYEAEQTEMEQKLTETKDLKDKLQNNFNTAFSIHSKRSAGNTYVEKRRDIFVTWKDYVKREKNAVNVIGALARRTLRTEVFQRIARMAREKYLDSKAERICIGFRNLFLRNVLKHALSRWRENAYKDVVEQMEFTQQNFETTVTCQQAEMKQIQKTKHTRAKKVLDQNKMKKANTAFKEMAKILKALRVKREILKQNLAFANTKRALQKWFQRVQVTQYLRRRNEKVLDDYRKMKLRAIWNGWKNTWSDEKRAQRLLCKTVKRMQFLDVSKAFLHWQHFSISAKQREEESKSYGTKSVGQIFDKLIKRRMALALHQLKIRAFKKDYKYDFLRRVTRHCADYRTRHFFNKWRQQARLEDIAETVNTEGNVVLERNEAMRQAKAMRDYLVNSGYAPEEIENYLNENAANQKQNMQKGVIGMFFAKSEFQVMPKAFSQWKLWLARRKAIKQKAKFVMNLMRHPCAHQFYRWKYENIDAQARLRALSKQQIIDKIIADENLIGATEARLARMDDAIDHLAVQRETLLGHYMRGQKLAVALLRNNYMKTMFRAFMRWKRANQEFETRELMEQLDRTNQMISELGAHVGRLGDINRNLLNENEELRQTALDGIEIAKVVQELTKERESLSQDLVDRAGTIKRLIEDNNNLSVRLGMLQREAQELDMLNQNAAYVDAPQRDHY